MASIETNCFKLAEARIRKGMLPTELAKKAGVSKTAIYNIEKGKYNPTPALAKKIIEILEVPYDGIFTIIEGG